MLVVIENVCGHVKPLALLRPLITGQQMFDLVLFILIFWCFLIFFGALSPRMTLVLS